MVKELISVCGICICVSLLCKVIERHTKEQAVMLSIGACVIVMILMLSDIPVIFGKVDRLASEAGLDSSLVSVIFKSLGICWLTQFSSDICRDCGENASASVCEIFGKVQLIVLALPLFDKLTDIVAGIVQ